MKSFTPGDIIQLTPAGGSANNSTPIPVLVLAVKPPVPSCGPGTFITVLPLGENKPQGPLFTTPTYWLSLLDPNQ